MNTPVFKQHIRIDLHVYIKTSENAYAVVTKQIRRLAQHKCMSVICTVKNILIKITKQNASGSQMWLSASSFFKVLHFQSSPFSPVCTNMLPQSFKMKTESAAFSNWTAGINVAKGLRFQTKIWWCRCSHKASEGNSLHSPTAIRHVIMLLNMNNIK